MHYICKVFILFSMVSFIEANWKFTMKGDYCHKNCILLSTPDYQGYFSTAVFSSEAEKQQGEWLLEAQHVPGCSPFGEELILRHLITCWEEKRCWKQAGIFEELIPLKWSQSKIFSCLYFSVEFTRWPAPDIWYYSSHLFKKKATYKDLKSREN